MGNRQSNSQYNQSGSITSPEARTSTAASLPLPTSSPSVPPSPTDLSKAPYKVFISHAGEDKVTIAFPLRERLEERGITAFVDKKDILAGTEAAPTMIDAMQTASVGVFVMSPEFVAREWPMKELMHFLARCDECKSAGRKAPLIIPLFYRLSIHELYDEPRLDRNDKDGNKLYEVSRFYQRQRNEEPEANIAQIKAALTRLYGFMGVENVLNANNDSDYGMHQKREMILNKLCDQICTVMRASTIESTIADRVSEAVHDTFKPYFDTSYDVSELVFDFDRRGSNGDICTQEGKALDMLLDNSMLNNRAIVVQGIGGVGKTSLLRKMQSLDRVIERFKDGIYCMELGKNATHKELQKALTRAVSKSGGNQTAEKMCTEIDMREVMEAFLSWFAQKTCLFMIDDVWLTEEMTRRTIHNLRSLHSSGTDSKTLLTTRSQEIAADSQAYIFLKPRDPLEDESRAILYHYAVLKPEPTHDEDNKAVNDILKRCAGLPLLLCIAGKSVKTLSFRQGHEGCMAYRLYADQLKKSMGEMITMETESYEGLSARLNISIELVEERRKRFEFDVSCNMAEMHRRLSVMKKQMRVPMRMLKHLWELEHESEAARIVKEFEQVGLANVEVEKENRNVKEMLRLHDSVYEFAVYETKKCKDERIGHKTIVERYGRALEKDDVERKWWSQDLEDDRYIHQNLCRHLIGAGLEEELFSLLLSPKWLDRQVQLNSVAFAEVDFSFGLEASRMYREKAVDGEDDGMGEALEMIKEAITLSAWYILRNRNELWFQIHGRLKNVGKSNKVARDYLKRIESDTPRPGVLCSNELLLEAGGANTRIISFGGYGVDCMALFKDGDRVACGCGNGDIAIVNVHRSEIELRWRAHERGVSAIIVGIDGTRIVSGTCDETAKVWNAQSGECVSTFDGHSDLVTCFSITEDGMRVVSGSRDGTVQAWDTENGERVSTPIYPGYAVSCLTMFRDDEHIIIGGWDGQLETWSVTTNAKVGVSFHGHKSTVRCAALTPDETRLVTGSRDGTIRIWDVETRRQLGNSFEGHTEMVICVATSNDGCRIVSGSCDTTIRVWNVESGQQVYDQLGVHTSQITGVSFLGEGDTIVSCSSGGSVRVWNLKRMKKQIAIEKHAGCVSGVSFTPDGSFVVSGSWDGTLWVWDAISEQTVGEPMVHPFHVNGVAVTPDGQFVVSVSSDKRVRLWDLQTRRVVCTFEGHTERVLCVAVTPDGEHAVTGSWDNVRIWELKSTDGSHAVLEGGHSAAVWSVFVSDDGKRIISVDSKDNIMVWDFETQTAINRMTRANASIMSRRQVLHVAGEATVHDEAGLSILLGGDDIIHGQGTEARVLGTLESAVEAWDVSLDKQTVCVGLEDGRVGFLKLYL